MYKILLAVPAMAAVSAAGAQTASAPVTAKTARNARLHRAILVTYRGRPRYTFYTDRRSGDIGGEGFEDVGVWHAVVARRG